MTQITELKETDLEDLAGLYRQFWNEGSDISRMRAEFQRLSSNPDYIFLAARKGGKLVGSAMGIVCRELYGQCRPFMVIEDVVIDTDHRRQGVGSMLMRELERLAGLRECGTILFVTEQDRTAAHRFYESLGYAPDRYRGFKKRLGNDN